MAPNIILSRPTFPVYLLPSINLPFRRRPSSTSTPDVSQVPSLSSSPTSSTTDETLTPPNSPPPPSYQDAITTSPLLPLKPQISSHGSASRPRLARTNPDTLRCSTCSSDIAFSSQIVSKGFTGRYGRAYLVAPTAAATTGVNDNTTAGPATLANVRIGKCENRQLVTGWHVVADITCVLCSAKLGWKYVDAKELSQKYKINKFILEVERVVPFRSWEDVPADFYDVPEDEGSEVEEDGQVGEDRDETAEDAGPLGDGIVKDADKEGPESEEVEIVFDSEDEDDLEDLFAGTWDPEVAAKRRSRRVPAARKK
ncbi:Protein yippee-like [Colletotrichum chlorophyti]|uniref:Protein yippee-like n=1 Tax=Colletotrichum chlorophyti TaxID=708187 RepID=A0A1Q8RMW0_9PEZI|nr:Protein yippee-like [Colletotrichum chlorophyti]